MVPPFKSVSTKSGSDHYCDLDHLGLYPSGTVIMPQACLLDKTTIDNYLSYSQGNIASYLVLLKRQGFGWHLIGLRVVSTTFSLVS